MTRINWTQYASNQIQWAESLLANANDIHGFDSKALYAKSAATLDEVSRLIRREIDLPK